jgi:hypothetical protein
VAFVVVEYDFDPPITDEGLGQLVRVLGPCTAARRIERLRSVISQDGTRGYCELEAPDAETVREAYRLARVPFRAVWEATTVYRARARTGGDAG